MRVPVRPALTVWFAGRTRSTGEQAYLVYLTAMIVLVVVVPVIRAVYLAFDVLPGFSAERQTAVAVASGAGLWVGAVVAGRERGPALYPPTLTDALAVSPLRRSAAFARPAVRGILGVALGVGLVSGLVAAGLAANELATRADAVLFTAAGLAAGVVTGVLWLAGQALSRRVSFVLAMAIVLTGLGALARPDAARWSPMGLLGSVYPVEGADASAGVALGVLAVVGLVLVPWLLGRLRFEDLVGQADRWDTARTLAISAEFSAVGDRYRSLPSLGRRWTAVRPARSIALTIVWRDAIAMLRTPARTVIGVVALGAAGALTAWAIWVPQVIWVAAGPAGLLAYAGAGPLTDGIRHAAAMARYSPLYGISDARLMTARVWMPLVLGSAATVVGALIVVTAPLDVVGQALVGAVLLAGAAVLARLGDALKGPMPAALLTPMLTPMGDLSAVNRLVWAFDVVLVMIVTGFCVAALWTAPWAAGLVGLVGAFTLSYRWGARRGS